LLYQNIYKMNKSIKDIIKGYKLSYVSKVTMIPYKTLWAQLDDKNPRELTLENEIKIRQAFTN
jgi:hypothetical protein